MSFFIPFTPFIPFLSALEVSNRQRHDDRGAINRRGDFPRATGAGQGLRVLPPPRLLLLLLLHLLPPLLLLAGVQAGVRARLARRVRVLAAATGGVGAALPPGKELKS